jgi:hypothetical protein
MDRQVLTHGRDMRGEIERMRHRVTNTQSTRVTSIQRIQAMTTMRPMIARIVQTMPMSPPYLSRLSRWLARDAISVRYGSDNNEGQYR